MKNIIANIKERMTKKTVIAIVSAAAVVALAVTSAVLVTSRNRIKTEADPGSTATPETETEIVTVPVTDESGEVVPMTDENGEAVTNEAGETVPETETTVVVKEKSAQQNEETATAPQGENAATENNTPTTTKKATTGSGTKTPATTKKQTNKTPATTKKATSTTKKSTPATEATKPSYWSVDVEMPDDQTYGLTEADINWIVNEGYKYGASKGFLDYRGTEYEKTIDDVHNENCGYTFPATSDELHTREELLEEVKRQIDRRCITIPEINGWPADEPTKYPYYQILACREKYFGTFTYWAIYVVWG